MPSFCPLAPQDTCYVLPLVACLVIRHNFLCRMIPLKFAECGICFVVTFAGFRSADL